jgi:hypothetical protein
MRIIVRYSTRSGKDMLPLQFFLGMTHQRRTDCVGNQSRVHARKTYTDAGRLSDAMASHPARP